MENNGNKFLHYLTYIVIAIVLACAGNVATRFIYHIVDNEVVIFKIAEVIKSASIPIIISFFEKDMKIGRLIYVSLGSGIMFGLFA